MKNLIKIATVCIIIVIGLFLLYKWDQKNKGIHINKDGVEYRKSIFD